MNPPKRWSPEQIETLRRLYPNTPISDICDATGHNPASVARKAEFLGLQRSPDYNPHGFYGRYVRKKRDF